MSNGGIYMDPVADGKPSRSRFAYGISIVLLGIAGFHFMQGEVVDALLICVFAFLVYDNDRVKRVYWMRGYSSAVKSVGEQGSEGVGE